LATGPASGMLFDDLLKIIRKKDNRYSEPKLSSYLDELALDYRGGLVRCGVDRRYRFAEPVYHTAARAMYTVAKATLNGPEGVEVHFVSQELTPVEQLVTRKVLGNAYAAPRNWNLFGGGVDFSQVPGHYDANSGLYTFTSDDSGLTLLENVTGPFTYVGPQEGVAYTPQLAAAARAAGIDPRNLQKMIKKDTQQNKSAKDDSAEDDKA
jgi:hypothetical protein